MNYYIFILGRDYELSLLELVAYFKRKNIRSELKEYNKKLAVFSLPKLDFSSVIKELGGCVKIAEVIDVNDLVFDEDKVIYSLNNYDGDGKIVKKLFKEQKVKGVAKKPAKGKLTLPNDVIKHDLLNNYDFILYKNYVARTIAVFNPNEYKERDKRPFFDEKRVISIRLAKILINLSEVKGKLLDPFCGVGTILQEAMLIGFDVFGVEIDKETVDMANKNLEWIKRKYDLKSEFKVVKGDARRISEFIDNVSFVVSEPYLGPFLRTLPGNKGAMKIKKELEELYHDFLKDLKKILKKGFRVVFIIPRFRTKGGEVKLDFLDIISKLGYKVCEGFDDIKYPILYKYEKSMIEREIYVLC